MTGRVFTSAPYVAAALLLAAPASAQQIESSYTDLNLNVDCTVIESDDFGTMWACEGLKGIPVMVTEGDLRMFVSYGLHSTTEKAAEQTLQQLHDAGHQRDAVPRMMTRAELYDLLGYNGYEERDRAYFGG